MNNDLDVNLLVQTFNERMSQMMTEIVIKEATIKQLTAQIEQLTAQQKTVKTTKTKIRGKHMLFMIPPYCK